MNRYKLLLSNGVEQVVKVGKDNLLKVLESMEHGTWLNCIGVLDNDIEVSMYIRCKDVVSVCPIPNNEIE